MYEKLHYISSCAIHLCLLQSNDFGFHSLGLLEASSSCRVPKSTYLQFLCLTYFSGFLYIVTFFFYFIAQLFLLCINKKILSFTAHLSSESFSDSVQREILMHWNTWNTFQTSLFLSLTVICQADLIPVALVFFMDNKKSYHCCIMFCGLKWPLLLWIVVWLIWFAVISV